MTTSLDERQRLAAMGNALRPDWPAGSLLTFITQNLKHRTGQQIAVALAYAAMDPEVRTPGVLAEPGPWWEAARPIAAAVGRGEGKCVNCQTFHSPQAPCNVRQLRSDKRNRFAALARADLHTRHGNPAPIMPAEEEPDGCR